MPSKLTRQKHFIIIITTNDSEIAVKTSFFFGFKNDAVQLWRAKYESQTNRQS